MRDALSFGDVFLYEERHYVFFLESDGIFYCGRILDEEQAKLVLALYNRPSERISHEHIAFCFVQLSTEPFDGKIAHLARPESNIPNLPSGVTYVCTLDNNDRQHIIGKISETSGIPVVLKKYVSSLEGDV